MLSNFFYRKPPNLGVVSISSFSLIVEQTFLKKNDLLLLELLEQFKIGSEVNTFTLKTAMTTRLGKFRKTTEIKLKRSQQDCDKTFE